MKQYLGILRELLLDGVIFDKILETKISIHGGFNKFDLTNGKIPLITTDFIDPVICIKELLFFISGKIVTNDLSKDGVTIWDDLAIKEGSVKTFFDSYFSNRPKEEIQNFEGWYKSFISSIGPLYGAMWRNAPIANPNPITFDLELADVPSDKLTDFKEKFSRLKLESKGISFGAFIVQEYYKTIDQFNELIRNIKKNPYSNKHVVESWIPETLACEYIPSDHNAMINRGAILPRHKSFHCFVLPPKVENGKKQLILQLHHSTVEMVEEAPRVLAQYGILAHMLAKECDLEAVELQWVRGETFIYKDQVNGVMEQLNRIPNELATIWLDPDIKDIYSYKPENIIVKNYNHHEKIDF